MDAPLYCQAGPGHWNDPDMLVVGVRSLNSGAAPLTAEQGRAHFSMWAMLAAPLISGADLTTMSEDTRKTLTNKKVIAINQDKLGIQAKRIILNGTPPQLATEVWTKPLSNGDIAVAFLNLTPVYPPQNQTFSDLNSIWPWLYDSQSTTIIPDGVISWNAMQGNPPGSMQLNFTAVPGNTQYFFFPFTVNLSTVPRTISVDVKVDPSSAKDASGVSGRF